MSHVAINKRIDKYEDIQAKPGLLPVKQASINHKMNNLKDIKKKHILFIIENSVAPLDPRVWSEALAAKKWGYEVTVLCPTGWGYESRFEIINGIKIFRHSLFRARRKKAYILEYCSAFIWEVMLSFKIYFKKPFHIIHGANPPDHLFLVAGLFKIFGVKYIFDHHDLAPENYVAKFNRKDIFYRLLLLMEKYNFKLADIVISTNDSYKSIAVQRGGMDKEDVFVVRNGPQLDKLYYPVPNEKWKRGFDYLVAYIGAIGEQDQLDVLLKIVESIVNKRKITTIKFIVIGTGPNLEQVVQKSRKMGLSEYVQFTGYIPYQQVYEIFSTADVCVNPEHKNEFTDKSTMIKIMEYMSFGKPIIQFENTEGRVSAGEASIYVKDNNNEMFADMLMDLLKAPEKKTLMGQIGKHRVNNILQWDIQKMKLKEAYSFLFSSE